MMSQALNGEMAPPACHIAPVRVSSTSSRLPMTTPPIASP